MCVLHFCHLCASTYIIIKKKVFIYTQHSFLQFVHFFVLFERGNAQKESIELWRAVFYKAGVLFSKKKKKEKEKKSTLFFAGKAWQY